jgi:hypothetical protein
MDPLTSDMEMTGLWRRFAKLKQWVDSWSDPNGATPFFRPLPLPPHLRDLSPTSDMSRSPQRPPKDKRRKRGHPSLSRVSAPRLVKVSENLQHSQGLKEHTSRKVTLRPQGGKNHGKIRWLHGIPYNTRRREKSGRSRACSANADLEGNDSSLGNRHVGVGSSGSYHKTILDRNPEDEAGN